MNNRILFLFLLFSSWQLDASSDALLNSLYKNKSGFSINALETGSIEKVGGNATYGEITDEGVQKLIEMIHPTKDDVFYDLGSGIGRMATKMHLDSHVKKSVGIELAHTRHKQALDVKKELEKQNKLDKNRILDFKHGDIMKANIDDATIIYIASTCFSDEFMQKLTEKLAQLKKRLKVFTLRPLAEHKAFKLVKEFQLPMTWSNNVTVYWYELQ